MSSSIFKDLEKQRLYQREMEAFERAYQREQEAMDYQRDNEPEIIYESEWYQGFGSECKEYLGIDSDRRFYYGLEVGEEDLSWHGPYETRAEAEEQLAAAYERWDKRVGQREEAWEAQQIAELEQEQGMER
jgi:hypothetical protein